MWTPLVKLGTIEARVDTFDSVKLPVDKGGTYKRLFFKFVADDGSAANVFIVNAAISKINLDATQSHGSFPILQNVKPAILFMRERYYAEHNSVGNTAGMLEYDPSAVCGLNAQDRRLYALGSADLSDLIMTLHFTNDVTGLKQVEVWAEYDQYDVQPLGAHIRIGMKSTSIGKDHTGRLTVDNLPKWDARFGYAALHFETPGASVIDDINMILNTTDEEMKQVPKSLSDRILLHARRKPQAGFLHLDFAKDDTPLSFQRAGQTSLVFEPNFKTAPGGLNDTNLNVWYELKMLHPQAAASNA